MSHTPQWVLDRIERMRASKSTSLDLTSNRAKNYGHQLHQIPPEVFDLNFLTVLKLDHHHISDIPAAISKLKNLIILDLSNNKISTISASIATLQSLKELRLGSNQIKEIPAAVFQLSSLEILDLRDNEIGDIPMAIANLENLKALDLESNQIQEIPTAIAQLKNLESLDLGWNQIRTIPQPVIFAPQLKTLNIFNNHVDDLSHDIIEKGLAAIRDYYQHLDILGYDYLYEAKLILLGEASTGKTTLVHHLIDDDSETFSKEATAGIDIHEWEFPYQESTFRVNIWDFGGQEKYESFHHFFLNEQALYLLVADPQKEPDRFQYWVNLIRYCSKESPVILLLNEKSGEKISLDEHHLHRELPHLLEIVRLDLSQADQVTALIPKLQQALQSLPYLGDRLPSPWITFRTFLKTDSTNHLTLAEYQQLCADFGIRKPEDQLALSRYLHNIGAIVHLQDDEHLKQCVILHPEWLASIVYQLLNHPEIIANYGTFSRQDLSVIALDTAFERMQDQTLEMMLQFQLCYRLTPTANNYVCPQLLDAEHPRYKWNASQNLIVRYHYEFMPKDIICFLTTAMSQYIEKQQLVWRNGVILKRDQTEAEVIASYTHRVLRIRIRGKEKQALMQDICHELDRIHRQYSLTTVQKFIPCNCPQCLAGNHPEFYDQADLERYLKSARSTIECRKSLTAVNVRHLLTYAGIATADLLPAQKTSEPPPIEVPTIAPTPENSLETAPEISIEAKITPKISRRLNKQLLWITLAITTLILTVVLAQIFPVYLWAIALAGLVGMVFLWLLFKP